jgi:hypothetical protein
MKVEFSRQISEKVLNIKFHQNSPTGSRVVPCGQTDITKLTVAFRNFANAPQGLEHSFVADFVVVNKRKLLITLHYYPYLSLIPNDFISHQVTDPKLNLKILLTPPPPHLCYI